MTATVLWLLNYMLSLETDVIEPAVRNKPKKLRKTNLLSAS